MVEATPLWRLGAEEIARGVGAGELSAAAVVDACLARTGEVEPVVGAYLARFDDDARRQADEVDRRVAAGHEVGPLAGVPVALKDNLSLAGAPLSCASRILAGYVAPFTATAVERLVAAGAVILGKTNLDEFAMGSSCENSALATTRNPCRLDRVPGGSSGGSAAAVAAGSVPLALGSDTGGSIRQPAALCGVVGLKPTWGRVSRWGLVAFASSLDQVGPLTRGVRDAALALGVIAGADGRDATALSEPVDDYLAGIDEGAAGLRVGVVREIDAAASGDATSRVWEAALDRLRAGGAEVVEVSIPTVRAAIAVYYVVANCEASANLARFDGVRYGRRAAAESLGELYVASRSEGFGAEVKRRVLLGTFALSAGYHEAYYGRARGVLEAMRREFDAAFAAVDLIVTPTAPGGAFALGERTDDPLAMYLSDVFTTPASLVGLPAVAVPAGADEVGLPLSLQVIGRPFAEAAVLRLARAFERATSWRVEPALA
jgi:aspartyl-tRNA(Asn)/glutamyl-tRNA(Gln) amidotransferase subunit A